MALDWKWLFLYPEQGVAAVNEMAAPVDRPIQFKITSSSVMNSFFVPALAGQIYAMPGMQTTLHAVINHPGEYEGLSANYSGAGFSGMRFRFHGVDQAGFDRWIAGARASGATLDRATYLKLEQPSERNPVQQYASVASGLFDAVVNRCVETNRMCMKDAMAIDARGGMGLPGARNLASLDAATRERIGLTGRPGSTWAPCAPRPRNWPCSRPRPGRRARRRGATPVFYPGIKMTDQTDLAKLIFGRLTWDAIPCTSPS